MITTASLSDGQLFKRLPESIFQANHFDDIPTTLFEIRDFLPNGVFELLAESFPGSDSDYRTHQRGKKKYLQNSEQAFWDVLDYSPAWRWIYNEFCNTNMIKQLEQLAVPHMAFRPSHERMPWRLKQTLRCRPGLIGRTARALHTSSVGRILRRVWTYVSACPTPFRFLPQSTYTPVGMGFEFSILTHGDAIPPRTDQVDKLLSLMLYFPDSDEQAGKAFGTEFWQGRKSRLHDRLRYQLHQGQWHRARLAP